MLDIQFIRRNPELLQTVIVNKNLSLSVQEFLDIDNTRSVLLNELEQLRAKKNSVVRQMKGLQDLSGEHKNQLIQEGKQLKQAVSQREKLYEQAEARFQAMLYQFPSVYSTDTPIGKTEDDNLVLRQVGEKPNFDFEPLEHWQLGKNLGIIDTEKSAQISGSRFAYLKGDLVLLQFALIQWVMSVLQDEDLLRMIMLQADLSLAVKTYTPVIPPVLMKSEIMGKMARLEPIDDRYQTTEDGLMLVGSAEHTLGPLHLAETLDYSQLPLRYVGYSTAFRREAGTYGKDMKGILRLHQFDKIEIEVFSDQDTGLAEQDLILAIQEYLMQQLQLPYQVVLKCSADMGVPDVRAYDIETWLPGQNQYRETHTSDYMGDFQARRLQTQYKDVQGQKKFVHMNDATVFAIGRVLIAIMENNQQKDGTILIPAVLRPYLGKDRIQ